MRLLGSARCCRPFGAFGQWYHRLAADRQGRAPGILMLKIGRPAIDRRTA
jgi:hypothetical protein